MEELKNSKVKEAKERLQEEKKKLQTEKKQMLKEIKGSFNPALAAGTSNIGESFNDFMDSPGQIKSAINSPKNNSSKKTF